jgi:serpin B
MLRSQNSLTVSFQALVVLAGALLSSCGGGSVSDDGGPELPPVNELRSNKPRITAPIVGNDDKARFAHDNLAFSVDMYHSVRSGSSGNFVYSQPSISTALAMMYAGAATTTAEQMADTLHFSLPGPRLHAAFNALDLALSTPPSNGNASAFQLEFANSVWIQKDFSVLPAYLDTLAENYGTGLYVEDFMGAPETARSNINQWVAASTENQIPALFPRGTLTSDTRLVLANAVFFHGDWKVPFLKDSPTQVFHTLTGDVMVPTMHGVSNAGIWNGSGWNAAAIDYVGDTTSMIVVVPDAGTFPTFESGLTAEVLETIFAGIRPGSGADLYMPRFKFSTDVMLNQTLADLGMPEAFTDLADFSGINGARTLSIQTVVHKAIINVDEKGTTASAATGVGSGVTSAPPSLFVDRPFLFFVRHHPTGAILFQGRVVDPSEQNQ